MKKSIPNKQSEKGYTFIEIMMVLGILTVLFGFTITVTNATRSAQNSTKAVAETGDIIEAAVNMRRFSSDFNTISNADIKRFAGLPPELTSGTKFTLANESTATIANSLTLPAALRPGFKLTLTVTNENCMDYVLGLSTLEFYLRRVKVSTTQVYDSVSLTTMSPATVNTACNATGATKAVKIFVKGS